MEFDIENDLTINPFKLQEECVSHTGLYYKYSDACAEAKQNVSIAKDNLEVVTAERSLAIRRECSESGKKATEATIGAMVTSDSEVVEARKNLREMEGIYANLQVAVSAMDARRSELDNLVKLAVSNYYASNDSKSVSDNQSDEMVRRQIRKSMNRKDKDYD